jgi:non-heme chloroperoxidase
MDEQFEDYFVTPDGQQIYFCSNFHLKQTPFEKPCLIFSNGLACSWDHWKYQLPYFHRLGFPILIYDYRNHFKSFGPLDLKKITFDQLAMDLKNLMDHLKIPSGIFIGHSMGVTVSLVFYSLYPEMVKKLVLISGTIISPLKTMLNPTLMEKLFPLIKKLSHKHPYVTQLIWDLSPDISIWQGFIHQSGFNSEQTSIDEVSNYLKKIRQLTPEIFFHLFDLMNKENLKKELDHILAETLVISGENDLVIPNHIQEKLLIKIPNHYFFLVKDGSHVPQLDFPNEINERILTFIQNGI